MILKLKWLMVLAWMGWTRCFEVLSDEDNNYHLVKDAVEGRVINGYDAPEGLAPYVVRLKTGCGGSILNEHFILSAAHCNKGDTTTIIYGATDLLDPEAKIATSERFINHPHYVLEDINRIKHIQNDIAVIKVRGSLDLSGRAKAIPLTRKTPPYGTPVLVVGWGSTFWGSGQAIKLQAANMSISTCDPFPDTWVTFICTRQKEMVGAGDSGGPLAANGELVGVVSFMSAFGHSGFSDVGYYRSWIEKTMNEYSMDIQ